MYGCCRRIMAAKAFVYELSDACFGKFCLERNRKKISVGLDLKNKVLMNRFDANTKLM